ncbi:MAG: hypothetical protein IAE77_15770 [Prosthecobacter sp.]|jgi:hypothetical protein|uniref:hypothetical protein n=1 Tax=Prosthecobacter sp. TaxID=1965333 RepID=UPI0019D91358|nr:hypothetical protein [Prosthecobacter sp.]MBE2284918.1 hypothetical protein [Prosthecobacter sp.]
MMSLSSAQKNIWRLAKRILFVALAPTLLLIQLLWVWTYDSSANILNSTFTDFAVGGAVLMIIAVCIYFIFTTASGHADWRCYHRGQLNTQSLTPRVSDSAELGRFYSGGAVAMKPLVDLMGDFSARHKNLPLVLLLSRNGALEFKAGWYCSPTLGLSLAAQIEANSPNYVTHQCIVKVAERLMSVFSVPFATRLGTATLLILQPDEPSLDMARNAFMQGAAPEIPSLVSSMARLLETQAGLDGLGIVLPPPKRLRMITSLRCPEWVSKVAAAKAEW